MTTETHAEQERYLTRHRTDLPEIESQEREEVEEWAEQLSAETYLAFCAADGMAAQARLQEKSRC